MNKTILFGFLTYAVIGAIVSIPISIYGILPDGSGTELVNRYLICALQILCAIMPIVIFAKKYSSVSDDGDSKINVQGITSIVAAVGVVYSVYSIIGQIPVLIALFKMRSPSFGNAINIIQSIFLFISSIYLHKIVIFINKKSAQQG